MTQHLMLDDDEPLFVYECFVEHNDGTYGASLFFVSAPDVCEAVAKTLHNAAGPCETCVDDGRLLVSYGLGTLHVVNGGAVTYQG